LGFQSNSEKEGARGGKWTGEEIPVVKIRSRTISTSEGGVLKGGGVGRREGIWQEGEKKGGKKTVTNKERTKITTQRKGEG